MKDLFINIILIVLLSKAKNNCSQFKTKRTCFPNSIYFCENFGCCCQFIRCPIQCENCDINKKCISCKEGLYIDEETNSCYEKVFINSNNSFERKNIFNYIYNDILLNSFSKIKFLISSYSIFPLKQSKKKMNFILPNDYKKFRNLRRSSKPKPKSNCHENCQNCHSPSIEMSQTFYNQYFSTSTNMNCKNC